MQRKTFEIVSLAVAVSITHARAEDLSITLISPTGARAVLLNAFVLGVDVADIHAVYTPLNTPALASLAGVSARGEWTLAVENQFGNIAGTLDRWGLEIFGSAVSQQIFAGGSKLLPFQFLPVETRFGTPRLLPGETLAVDLDYSGSGVMFSQEQVTLTADAPSKEVTLTAGLDATEGALTAAVADPPVGVTVEPAALPLEIVPRRFRLEFRERVSYENISSMILHDLINVLESDINVEEDLEIVSLALTMSITNPNMRDLLIILMPPTGVEMALYSFGEVDSDINAPYTSMNTPFLASLVGMSAKGEWRLRLIHQAGSMSIHYDAGVLNRWVLEITYSPTESQVLVGGSKSLSLQFLPVETPFVTPRLLPGETLAVDLDYSGSGVTFSPEQVTLTADAPSMPFTFTAGAAVTSGTLIAAVMDPPVGATVEPAAMLVEIVPRRFRLEFGERVSYRNALEVMIMDFLDANPVTSAINIEEDFEIVSLAVTVSITHPEIRDLYVEMSFPTGAGGLLYSPAVGAISDIDMPYTSMNTPLLASLVGVSAKGEWQLFVADLEGENRGTLDEWRLEITYRPTEAQVPAGNSNSLSLQFLPVETPFVTPRLLPGETLAVDLDYSGSGLTFSPEQVTLTADAPSMQVTFTAGAAMTSGTLIAAVMDPPVGATVEPAAVPVRIVQAISIASLSTEVAEGGCLYGLSPFTTIDEETGETIPRGDYAIDCTPR